jgi:DNA-binding CsgD family transcriptional regulator
MLQQGYTSVLEAGDRDQLLSEIVQFTQKLGFETVSATTIIDHMLGDAEFITLDNTPASYRDNFENKASWRVDPVMQHCKRQSVPIIWDQNTYTAIGLGEKWEHQAQFGYQTGIAMALHLPEGRHFFFGVDRDQPLPKDPNELTRIVADLQLFAVHAQHAAHRVLLPKSPDPDIPSLTPRELECLRWTMEGKTAWEAGSILGITERTAVSHLTNAAQKLGCGNKHQTVLKALRMGLLK